MGRSENHGEREVKRHRSPRGEAIRGRLSVPLDAWWATVAFAAWKPMDHRFAGNGVIITIHFHSH
ncbi:hypothetical protein RSAG8_13426, partial [Rhizoctonia solani AG-8 WAC10335]